MHAATVLPAGLSGFSVVRAYPGATATASISTSWSA
jgi:hypothetical protein